MAKPTDTTSYRHLMSDIALEIMSRPRNFDKKAFLQIFGSECEYKYYLAKIQWI